MDPKWPLCLREIPLWISDQGAMFSPINQAKERVLAPLRTGYNVKSNTRLEAKSMYPDNAANLLRDFAQIPSSLCFPSSQSSVIPMSSKSLFNPRILSLSLLPKCGLFFRLPNDVLSTFSHLEPSPGEASNRLLLHPLLSPAGLS